MENIESVCLIGQETGLIINGELYNADDFLWHMKDNEDCILDTYYDEDILIVKTKDEIYKIEIA